MAFVTLQNEVYKLQSEGRPDKAIELLTAELKCNPDAHHLYFLRAHCLFKLDKFKEAVSDAAKAIELGSICDAHVIHGKALFNLGKFIEARKTFKRGKAKADPGLNKFNQFDQWVDWSEERIKRLGLQIPEDSDTEEMTETSKQTPEVSEETLFIRKMMPVPKIRHDWYQTETHVVITVLVRDQKAEDVKVYFTDKTVSVTAPLPNGSEYSLELDLCHPIKPSMSTFKVVPSKIEVKMKKVDCIQWRKLEGEGVEPDVKPAAPAEGSTKESVPSYPSSATKKHDWNKLEADLKAEEENEKLEGDAALNQLFQKIYGQGSDETKRAMNKSFMESGGTVLSTNWREVKGDKVEVKPPDGMEYKKWTQ